MFKHSSPYRASAFAALTTALTISLVLAPVQPAFAQAKSQYANSKSNATGGTGTGVLDAFNSSLTVGQQLMNGLSQQNQPQLQGSQDMMALAMEACEKSANLEAVSDATSVVGDVAKIATKAVSKDKATAATGDACSATCTNPGLSESPTTRMYCQIDRDGVIQGDPLLTALDSKISEQKTYASCLAGKKACASDDLKAFLRQKKIYECQMQAFQDGVARASTEVQKAMQANQQQFSQMMAYQGEVQSQIQQTYAHLGINEKGEPVGGLVKLEAELTENLAQMATQDHAMKTQAQNLVQAYAANDQQLESSAVERASSCVDGDPRYGGRSFTCFKPALENVGTAEKPQLQPKLNEKNRPIYVKQQCSGLDYIASQLEGKALLNKKGKFIPSQDRYELSQEYLGKFGQFKASLFSAMGRFEGTQQSGEKVIPINLAAKDVLSGVQGEMDALANQTGLNIGGQVQALVNQCFKVSKKWKKDQMNHPSSHYVKKRNELDGKRSELVAQLEVGRQSLNKNYSDAVAIMGKQHATFNRNRCGKDDPVKLHQCFTQERNLLQNMLEGGEGTTTAFEIQPGTSVPGFTVPCQGITGCVTNLRLVAEKQREQLNKAQQATQSFVNQGQTQTNQALQGYAQYLGLAQASIMKQYDAMKASLAKLGLGAPDRPNMMDPEQLKASDPIPPSQQPGPYGQPKNMTAVLSGMVQPGGLVDMSNSGMGDVMKEVQDKLAEDKKDKAEKAKDAEKLAQEYANVRAECALGSNGKAGAVTSSWDECDQLTKDVTDTSPTGGALRDFVSQFANNLLSASDRASLRTKIADLDVDDDMVDLKKKCLSWVTRESIQQARGNGSSRSNASANSAND